MSEYAQRPYESFLDWKLRLIVGKIEKTIDLDWSEIKDILGLDVSSDHLRKTGYGAYEVYKHFEECKINNISDEDIVQEIDDKKFELDSKKQEIHDELTYLNKNKRSLSRTESMCKTLREVTESLKPQTPYIYIKPTKRKRIAVPLHSDGQVGEMVKKEDTAGFNKYNFEIYKQRQNKYMNEILNFCEEFKIDSAYIPFLGDAIEGNGTIYKRQKFYLENHFVNQIFQVSESNAHFLQGLNAGGIRNIECMGIPGNHGNDSYDNHAQANFDVVAYDRTQLLLQKNDNIKFQYSNTFMEVVNILGFNVLLIHGDGLNKQTIDSAFYKYAYMYASRGIPLYSLFCGHFHVPSNQDIMSTGGEIVINGNIVGSNHLSVQKLQADNRPSQTLLVFEEGVGITYKRKVLLD